MFGHDDQHKDDNKIPDASIQGALQGDDGANNPAPQAPENNAGWGHPGTPVSEAPVVVSADAPAAPEVVPATPVAETPSATPVNGGDDLISLKQKALNDLSPLLSHLDQTPEDQFRTTMMMIQASDNQSLVPKAYEAANAIQDEKAKAQALLDVINEINYFTQHPQHEQ